MSLDPKALKSIARTQLVDEEDTSAMFEFAAVTNVDINSQKVFRGVAFSWSKRFTIIGSGSSDIVIDPQAIAAEKVFVILPAFFQAALGGPIDIDLYFGTDSNEDGTLWAGFNRDARSSTLPATKVRLNPTINNVGTQLPVEFQIPSNGVAAVANVGGEVIDKFITIGRKDGKYMFRLTNQDTVPVKMVFGFDVFEVAEGI